MPAVFTFNPGKTEMVIPTVQIAVDHLHHIGPPESVFVNVAVIPDCCQIFKVGLNTAIIAAGAGFSGLIDVKIVGLRCAIQHGRCSFSVLQD